MARPVDSNGPVPAGGLAGAVLVKRTADDGDFDWAGKAAPATTFTQTYSTTQTTVPAATFAATAVAPVSTAATNSSPYGYTQTQADAIKTGVIALVTDTVALAADVLAIKKVVGAVIDVIQAAGLAL